MKRIHIGSVLVAAILTVSSASRADDIDLFIDAPASADLPNVLFIVDNTANWSSAFANEMSALRNTFNNLPVNSDGSAKFNVGVMFFAETSSSDSNIQGGYVRAAMRPMNAVNKAKYAAMFQALDVNKDKGNSGQSSLGMAEAYRYFSAGAANSGNNKAKADYTGNTGADWSNSATTSASLAAMQEIYALSGNALSAKSATLYNSGISGCSKNFIIYVSNGAAQDSNSVKASATSMLSAAGGNTTQIPLSPSGSQDNVSDEWARYMKTSTLGVVTYTIDVDPTTSGQGPGWTAVLKSMATVSSGKYAAVTSSTGAGQNISDAVGRALSEIQAVNTVFASVSLPVSVNTQGTYLDQVYVGMFRPDASALPRWTGNLKQYKLGMINGALKLEDADDNSAINGNTGFITECARSYWTPNTADSYWSFNPQGGCIPPVGSPTNFYKNSNFPDGNIVEKGAQGYVLRTSTVRTLKTCSANFSLCTSTTDFNVGNAAITQSLLGAASSTERDALINWASGLDIDDENTNTVTSAEMRASAHGDVVHSRPVAINFGTDASPKVVVFYGGNDGTFRAVNGNRSTNVGTVAPGKELWAFIPPEFYSSIKRLRDNSTLISFPNITVSGARPKPYGIDGAITAYKDNSNAWIYASMRRGGRALYAFDVNVSNPDNISLKWKVGCPNNFPLTGVVDDTGCTTGFTGIGQTWSSAKSLLAAGYSSGTAPLIIMGGGYDSCEDANPNNCTASTKGNKVFVLAADSGNLLKTFTTDRSVVADIMIVPDASTGLAKYAYVVDLGGNIYRIDIGTNIPANWTVTKIASLGCDTTTACTYNRKLMFAPDVVEDNGAYDLLLGSGDREKPRVNDGSVTNYFFMVKDKPSDSTWLSSEVGNCGSAVLCLNSLLGITTSATPTAAALGAKKGWYLGLSTNEQVVTAAITIFGTVTFSTHQATAAVAGMCTSNLGTARVYNVLYSNATSLNGTSDRSELLPPNIGLPPSPVGGMVTLDDNSTVPFCIGCNSASPLEGSNPTVPPATGVVQPKGRVYWFIQR